MTAEPRPQAKPSAEELRVLLVEDSPDDAEMLLIEMRRSGYEPISERVQTAADLAEALDRSPWDIILADYSMPGFTGLEALHLVQERGLDIPLIIVSGTVGEELAVEAMAAGAADYLLKDRLARLAPAIRRAMESAALRRERRHAEQQLRRSEALLRIAGRITHLGAWAVDLTENKVFWSDEVAAIHEMPVGYSPTVEKAISFYAPESRDRIAEVFKACAEEGVPYDEELQIITSRGRRVWVRTVGEAVRDADGRIVQVRGAFQDITERKEAEAERERLLSAIEQAAEVIVITDQAGVIEYVNPAFEQVTGYRAEEALGKTPSLLSSGLHDEAFYRELWETISSGRVWQGRFINRRKDGTLYTEETTISPAFDEHGNIANYVSVMRDITAELEREEQFRQAQKMESIGRLAGGIAHDFNNMLAIILGHVELVLTQYELPEAARDDLRNIQGAAERSARLTRQLLAFSRRQLITPQVIDLNKTVEGMLSMLRRLVGEDINLIWRPGAGLSKVKMDPAQIDQLLANLVTNARDAIPSVGKITIETACREFDESSREADGDYRPGTYVMLSVADDGRGMDPDTLSKIFEPFYTTKEEGQGTGFGLATVYGIVKQNEGFVHVQSEPGEGTVFKVYLPGCEEQETPSKSAGQRTRSRPPRDGEKPSPIILLVEDEPTILKLAERVLRRSGYEVLGTNSPVQALELARNMETEIDLLITDVVMPEMSGGRLASELAALHPGTRSLFMSGYTENVIAHRGVVEADVNFIPKPFSIEELVSKVRDVLEA
ncbi:MAG: hypothetical protein Kow00129_09230 [Thermoleophilia bacterium]